MILSIRTDKPEAEIGLWNEEGEKLAYEAWTAHRQLAETIHIKIRELLKNQSTDWQNITGVIVFAGPGSFTGLRIGIATANALAHSLDVPIAAAGGEDWTTSAKEKLQKTSGFKPVSPEYGADVFITKPTK